MSESMIFPPHKASLHLTHNDHKTDYLSAKQWIEQNDEDCSHEWVSAEQKQKAIETDSIWILHWYPNTPVSFHRMIAADLDVLLQAAIEL